MSKKALESKFTALGVSENVASAFAAAIAIVVFALLTAAAAHVKIPVPGTVVPMTLQTAVVLLAGLSLGRRDAVASQVAYILGGAADLPFFATVNGSFLFGPTFGYLIGFVIAAAFAGSFDTKGSFTRSWLIAFVASLLVFVPGVLQLKLFTQVSWTSAFMMGVVPFIVGDFVKVTAAAAFHALCHRIFR